MLPCKLPKPVNRPFALLCCWLALTLCAAATLVRAQEDAGGALPARPARFFNDYALATRPDTQETLNHRLADFERETSNQLLVAVFPKLPDGAEVADYAQRVFRAWRPGQAGRDNGAILFVFLQNRKVRIQTGRGLEGTLPDALCRRIVAEQVAPRFKANDYDGGLAAGVDAMIAAAKGEYQGTGRTVAQGQRRDGGGGGGSAGLIVLFMVGIFLFVTVSGFFRRPRRGQVYGGDGRRSMGGGGPIFIPFGGFGAGGSGGGFGGGGGGGGSDDSFSGGGGDSGGGGAGGDW